MYQKILVPLDGSEFSECTLQHVRAIATGRKVPKVVLLRVVEPVPKDYRTLGMPIDLLNDTDKRLGVEAKDYLTKIAGDLKKEGIAAQTVIVQGTAAEEILDYARNNQVDLIVISTHGRSGVSRWAFGNVADRVLRHSTAPVLIAPPASCRV